MKRIILFTLYIVSLTLLAHAEVSAKVSASFLENGTKLTLNGLGRYQDLGEDLYIGAVYLLENTQSIELGASMRMEMRIVAERVTARKFARNWMEAIKLNSTRAQRQELAQEIQDLNSFFQNYYLKGDQIRFDYIVGQGTNFYVNQESVGKINGDEFYELLLNCWIGESPPSTVFKRGVLNLLDKKQSSEIQHDYTLLTYSQERVKEIEKRKRKKAEQILLAEIAENAQLKETALNEKKPANYIDNKVETLTLEQQSTKDKENQRIIEFEAAEKKRLELLVIEAYKQEQNDLRTEYLSLVKRSISKYVEYPKRALTRGVVGKVMLVITSDRLGEVINYEISESSKKRILDNSALETIENAAPFPEVPRELEGTSFTFSMPINFVIN